MPTLSELADFIPFVAISLIKYEGGFGVLDKMIRVVFPIGITGGHEKVYI